MSVQVIPLPEFGTNAKEWLCPRQALEEMTSEIRERPYHGEALLCLYDEPGVLPLAGFYVRSWNYLSEAGRRCGHTLHLYLSKSFPVYLFNFSAADLHDLPWNTSDARSFLLEKGREIHRQLTSAEA